LTRTHYTLDDIGGELPERALLSFLRRLPAESETVSELSQLGGWSRTEMLLARICEGIEVLAWLTANGGKPKSKQTERPKRIVRPGVEPDERRIGRGSISISDFMDWYFGGDD